MVTPTMLFDMATASELLGHISFELFPNKFPRTSRKLLCSEHCNAGPNINGSKFFICTAKTEWLNGKHVVPGKVKEGTNIVEAVERYGTRNGKTRENIIVAHCGQL
ncbi:hypothetical protein J1605_010187 [Eschrichtius robustus]|uniref:Peptidyl-prolyl cis-trans isomerase n=1 Tax=Eschrichtius robustus TaxID=9764 RepID=A0AB34GVN2_ESCRO|nr:hypothetical protein J1605_010187 [Eschrichtius robustus]MBW01957.1 Peptidyl-prolyl cis-trans isomerase A [Eschrichtius robustus]